ncbi:50S ribosomal protein L17 [Desulfovibrio sp. OttesenSCG-928-M14]|nr:50S ribosomal protein L17 [Desulfovibrio sp. OttesenSCG-928-M16]MDL2216150.1 50S ribosomal protein L17 [Desulfovibrio sp. OttesenSCG-928-M14]
MRHRKSGRKLGRNPSHRKALLRNMAKALLINGRITTTEAKAKTLRGVVEPLITLALKNDLHGRRQAYEVLGDHKLVKRLFDDIGPLYVAGGGGYTRVVKLALPRKGDAAPLALIELIRKPGEAVLETPAKAPKKSAAKLEAAAAPAPVVESAPEAVAEESPVDSAAEGDAPAEGESDKNA